MTSLKPKVSLIIQARPKTDWPRSLHSTAPVRRRRPSQLNSGPRPESTPLQPLELAVCDLPCLLSTAPPRRSSSRPLAQRRRTNCQLHVRHRRPSRNPRRAHRRPSNPPNASRINRCRPRSLSRRVSMPRPNRRFRPVSPSPIHPRQTSAGGRVLPYITPSRQYRWHHELPLLPR